MAYATFEDPDAIGNFSGFECLVTYEPVIGDDDYSSFDDVSLWNWYGNSATKYDSLEVKTDYFNAEMAAASRGPWVLPGDGTDTDIVWKRVMMKESDPFTTVGCGATRMIGQIPASVYGDSSLKFTWGEIPGFIDVKSGQSYSIQTGYKIFAETTFEEVDSMMGNPFDVSWVDSHSHAAGLAITVASAVVVLSSLF